MKKVIFSVIIGVGVGFIILNELTNFWARSVKVQGVLGLAASVIGCLLVYFLMCRVIPIIKKTTNRKEVLILGMLAIGIGLIVYGVVDYKVPLPGGGIGEHKLEIVLPEYTYYNNPGYYFKINEIKVGGEKVEPKRVEQIEGKWKIEGEEISTRVPGKLRYIYEGNQATTIGMVILSSYSRYKIGVDGNFSWYDRKGGSDLNQRLVEVELPPITGLNQLLVITTSIYFIVGISFIVFVLGVVFLSYWKTVPASINIRDALDKGENTGKTRWKSKQGMAWFPQILMIISISIILGTAWFLVLYGRYPLNFSYVDWIYRAGGDVFQHHLGWEWFRQGPWEFPLGRIEAYGYPFGTYLTYMDSIPLVAIPLKLFSPWLGDNFQYLGMWELASVVGQMLVGILILREFTCSYPNMILGASLLVLSPPMIIRSFSHNSLTAHWIVLGAIWFIILEYRRRLWRGAWGLLFAVSMLVHLYFTAMLLPLWGISLYFGNTEGKRRRDLVAEVIGVVGVILLVGYSIGLFSLSSDNLARGNFGYYSWNLNGLINPIRGSLFLKEMAVGTSEQDFEGFSYLGAGNLLILPFAFFLFFAKDFTRRRMHFLLPFVVVAFLLSLFALSQKAYWGSVLLWNIPLPDFILKLFSVFQSSGRFIWPVFYFLVLFGLIAALRNYRYATLVLLLGLVVQFIDLQPIAGSKKFHGFLEYDQPMQIEFWQEAAKTNRHIFLMPPMGNEGLNHQPISYYAQQNGLTMNWGYFARADGDSIGHFAMRVWEDLKTGEADPQTIYIFWTREWIEYAQVYLSGHMLICQVDGYTIAISTDNELTNLNFDLTKHCSSPF